MEPTGTHQPGGRTARLAQRHQGALSRKTTPFRIKRGETAVPTNWSAKVPQSSALGVNVPGHHRLVCGSVCRTALLATMGACVTLVLSCGWKETRKDRSEHQDDKQLASAVDLAEAKRSGYVARFENATQAQQHARLVQAAGGRASLVAGSARVLRVDVPAESSSLGSVTLPAGAVAMVDELVRINRATRHDSAATDATGPFGDTTPETDTHFAQNLLVGRDVVGVESLRQRFAAADGRHETIAILDTGIEFGAPGVSTFADGQRKVTGYYDLTGFGRLSLERVQDASDWSLDIAGTRHVFSALPAGTRIVAQGLLSEHQLAQDTIEPEGIDIDGDGETSDSFGVALVSHGDSLDLWIDINGDHLFANSGPNRHEQERLTDFNQTGVYLDARVTATGKGRPLAVSLPKPEELLLGNPVNVQFHTILGSHGTSCASIAAGERFIDGKVDGMAPGSRLLSLVIDATGRDVYRASTLLEQFFVARDHGATAISVSWGFATADLASAKAFAEILDQEVASRNIVIAMAAGNSGPGSLSAASDDYVPRLGFAIGAAVTEKQSRNVYGWLGVRGDHVVHYSSVGPTRHGRAIPDLISPLMSLARARRTGDSGAYVPFGGTSSATPAFVGAVAALSSALRDQGLPVHMGLLKDALLQSAKRLPGRVPSDRQGMGLVDVNAAFDVYQKLLEGVRAERRTDYTLVPAVMVDGSVPNGALPVHAPEGLVANTFVPQFRLAVTPTFRDDVSLVPPEIGSFADVLKVEVTYDNPAQSPWLETPESVVVQADGAVLPVRVAAALQRKTGLFSAEIRLVDTFGATRARVPVRFALPHRTAIQGTALSLEGTLDPFEVRREPLYLEKARALDLVGSFRAPSGVQNAKAVVSLFDASGNAVYRSAVTVDTPVVNVRVTTPELPAGHYEVQVFQQPGYLVQRLDYLLGIAHQPYLVTTELAANEQGNRMLRVFIRNERSLPIDGATVRLLGRDTTVTLNASPGRSEGSEELKNFPAFRGRLNLDDRDSRASWAVALVQSPIERQRHPFNELAVAYSAAGSGVPLAWDWLAVAASSSTAVHEPLLWQTVASGRGGEDDPAGQPAAIDVEAYANVGRFETISRAPVSLRVRTQWTTPAETTLSRQARTNEDWLLPDINLSDLVNGGATAPLHGEVVLLSKGQRVGVLPLSLAEGP